MIRRSFPATLLILLLVTVLLAGNFKPYPRSRVDQKATKRANDLFKTLGDEGPKLKATVYVTSDSFEKVVAFYKPLGTELTPSSDQEEPPIVLPNGTVMKVAVFIFDGAKDIESSASWAKIQRPYAAVIGTEGDSLVFEDIRNVTAIMMAQRR